MYKEKNKNKCICFYDKEDIYSEYCMHYRDYAYICCVSVCVCVCVCVCLCLVLVKSSCLSAAYKSKMSSRSTVF